MEENPKAGVFTLRQNGPPAQDYRQPQSRTEERLRRLLSNHDAW